MCCTPTGEEWVVEGKTRISVSDCMQFFGLSATRQDVSTAL